MEDCCTFPGDHVAAELTDVRVAFGGTPILRGVNMKIPAGEIAALIGPNGSGKTTLLRCLLGLQKPDSGTISLFGEKDISKAIPRIGYVPQKLALEKGFILSVREFLALRLKSTRHWFFQNRKKLDAILCETLEELGVGSLLNRPVSGLSGGQLQRVLIAFSLLKKPDLLLLDEPTAGVDTPGEHTFYELIGNVHKKHKMGVVLVSHDLSMVYKQASWVYALNGHICCQGSPEHVMNADSLKEAYGINVSPYSHHHHNHAHPH